MSTLRITDSKVGRSISLYTTLGGNDPQNRVCVNMKAGYFFNSSRRALPILFCTCKGKFFKTSQVVEHHGSWSRVDCYQSLGIVARVSMLRASERGKCAREKNPEGHLAVSFT